MKTICFYFQIHQPLRLKRYRFFDIGTDHYYYDDFSNDEEISKLVSQSYLPANQVMLDIIKKSNYKFKFAFSFSGIALEQLEVHAPEFIDGVKELIKTGCVEILSETYAHSLASFTDIPEFERQVKEHDDKIEAIFGLRPKVFRNTDLIYTDEIGSIIASMGYKGVLTEGAKHILGWKSPNYVYNCPSAPKLGILFNNFKLSDDIFLRFNDHSWNEFPLTADKFMDWIKVAPETEQVFNVFMGYDVLGVINPESSGIFEFFKAMPYLAEQREISFSTPSEIFDTIKPVDKMPVGHPISWADEERDVTAWTANTLQQEAIKTLYSISDKVRLCNDSRILQEWNYLQSSDHFYYMSTKHFSNGTVHRYSPYETPFEAFTNYMNVLADFTERVNEQFPENVENEELNALLTTIQNQNLEIQELKNEVKELQSKNSNANSTTELYKPKKKK
ncbi:MAG TPA: alpha-amylase [Porphyromonadaceae bacterium]|nr:alpha-amylase [Porphyromonadaceae bacterium]